MSWAQVLDEVPERDVVHYLRGLASQEIFFYANGWQRRFDSCCRCNETHNKGLGCIFVFCLGNVRKFLSQIIENSKKAINKPFLVINS